MGFEFRPARRENVSLLLGLGGGTGSGKTYTAMRLATGICAAYGRERFCVIDTEAGRAKHYADRFSFDHGDLMPPFRPGNYVEAIHAADKAGYPAIVVDSTSHEWAGDGGVLDWQEDELTRLIRGDEGKRDAMKMLSWQAPKRDHKKMVQDLLQVRAHLILCFRAEPKIEIAKDNGRTVVREKSGLNVGPGGWTMITDKQLPFELTASFMFFAEKPGVPVAIKLQEQHKALFPADRVVDEDSGRRVAEWAQGGVAKGTPAPPANGDWLRRIADAKTKAELLEVGLQLRSATLATATKDMIRASYDSRLQALAGK
jgi:hypothetical protein